MIPQFHDFVAYGKAVSWQMKVAVKGKIVPIGISGRDYFVNPIDPEVQEYQLSIIEEIVKEYEIDEVVPLRQMEPERDRRSCRT